MLLSHPKRGKRGDITRQNDFSPSLRLAIEAASQDPVWHSRSLVILNSSGCGRSRLMEESRSAPLQSAEWIITTS